TGADNHEAGSARLIPLEGSRRSPCASTTNLTHTIAAWTCMQGACSLSHPQFARALGKDGGSSKKGTVAGRLGRARGMLAKRLVRRGGVLSAGSLAAALAQEAASAGVPTAVISSTIQAVRLLAAGPAALAGAVAPAVAALTEGVLHTMFVSRLKTL